MKKNLMITLFTFLLLTLGKYSMANTVTIELKNVNDLEISAFQLFFDNEYGFPLDMDWVTFESDFSFEAGSAFSNSDVWQLDTLIKTDPDNEYADLTRGIMGASKSFLNSLKLKDGILLTMNSENTKFAADVNLDRNGNFIFIDFEDIIIELPDLLLTSSWDNDNQYVEVDFAPSAVPIPAAALLFGSGFLGLLGIRKKIRE